MVAFLYIGGFEFDDTELPAAVTIFGHKFIQEVPKTLTVADFPSKAAFDHAVMKLSGHQHFQKLEDDVHEVLREKKKPGRKPKPVVEVEDAEIITDAAE